MGQAILGALALTLVSLNNQSVSQDSSSFLPKEEVLAIHELDLRNRLDNPFGNQIFTDNILLSLHYLKGDVVFPINWEEIRKPFEVSFILFPKEIFAFHQNVLPEFEKPKITMNSKFYYQEGYKGLNSLGGNGVCHLASLINWTAKEAGLEVLAKVNHDFWPIPGIPREFGVSINSESKNQNLYLKNNFDFPVIFEFKINEEKIILQIKEKKLK